MEEGRNQIYTTLCTALIPGGSQRPSLCSRDQERSSASVGTQKPGQNPCQQCVGCVAKWKEEPWLRQAGVRGLVLGVGSAAGAAAGFAVVPVAAQVHLDGQGTVGSCLVLAAVVWGTENTRHGTEKKKKISNSELMSSFPSPTPL